MRVGKEKNKTKLCFKYQSRLSNSQTDNFTPDSKYLSLSKIMLRLSNDYVDYNIDF